MCKMFTLERLTSAARITTACEDSAMNQRQPINRSGVRSGGFQPPTAPPAAAWKQSDLSRHLLGAICSAGALQGASSFSEAFGNKVNLWIEAILSLAAKIQGPQNPPRSDYVHKLGTIYNDVDQCRLFMKEYIGCSRLMCYPSALCQNTKFDIESARTSKTHQSRKSKK